MKIRTIERILIVVLAIGFGTSLIHDVWGHRETPGVVYLVDYKSQEASKQLEGFSQLLHRIWIDNPSYVEDALFEKEEFIHLDSLKCHDWEDIFEYWSEEDSVQYDLNKKRQEIEAHLYLVHYREPDTMPLKLDE